MDASFKQQQKKKVSVISDTYLSSILPNYPDVSIVPQTLEFPRTYPHRSVESKVLISNSGIKSVNYTATIAGDAEFSISTPQLTIPAGGTYSVYVSFTPHSVSMYNGALIFNGPQPYSVSLRGHCVPSAFELPPSLSSYYTFTRDRPEQTIPLTNKDATQSLSIIAVTDCKAFTVSPHELEIPPLSTECLTVHYDACQVCADKPKLTLSCSQTDESFEMPLTVKDPRRVVNIDFGTTVINQALERTVNIGNTEDVVVPWPFSINNVSDDSDERKIILCSSKKGKFKSKIHLKDFDLYLSGSVIEPPFKIRVPQTFPKDPFYLHNTSKEPVRIILSSPSIPLSVSQFTIPPGETQSVSTIQKLVPEDAKLRIIWLTEGGQYEQVLSLSPTDNTELSKTELYTKSSEYENNAVPVKREKSDSLKASCSLIWFNSTQRNFSFAVKSNSKITITPPPFVTIPSVYNANEEIVLSADSDTDSFGYLTVANQYDSLRIPAIYVSNIPQLEISPSIKLFRKDDVYMNTTTVFNRGDTYSFILFGVTTDGSPSKIAVNPPSCIIPPKRKMNFEIIAENEGSIKAYTCNDICRKIMSFVTKDDFISDLKSPQDDEMSAMYESIVSSCSKKEIRRFFKKCLIPNSINLTINNQEGIKLLQNKLTFTDSNEQTITLVNSSSNTVEFVALPNSSDVEVDPISGNIPPKSTFMCKVRLLNRVNSRITFKCNGDILTADIIFEGDPKKFISVSHQENLIFPACSVGTLRRATLRVTNRSKFTACLFSSTKLPFLCPIQTFRIEPLSYILLPVHFSPQKKGRYQDKLRIESDRGIVISVDLYGECM